MDRIWVRGVVKNGQVVLDAPLGVPDGTVMTVTDFDPDDDPRPTQRLSHLTYEELVELDTLYIEERVLRNSREWEARLRRAGLKS